jgi:glycosyltransferase involved in cell wall biosynthesis
LKTLAILTGSFPPTNIVGALRPFRLAKHIGRNGWRVVVLTHPPRPGEGLDESLLGELSRFHDIRYVSRAADQRAGNSRFRARAAGAARDILKEWVKPDLDIVHVPAYCRAFKEAHEKHPVDVVLTTSPAHSIHLAGLQIKNQFGLPWVVDFRDPWDDYLKTGTASIRHPIEKYFERKVIEKSDAVVSTTEIYTETLSSRHGEVDRGKFFTVTNSFDRHKTGKPKQKSTDKFIICYTGIFYPDKDPYGFFRALRNWFEHMEPEECRLYRDRLEVHLIGSGDRITRQVIHDLQLEGTVVFFERVSHDQAIQKTLQADMSLICTGTGEKTRPGWLPSKLFEYLGCRVPILALIREGELADIIRRTNSGHILTTEDHAQVGALIKECMDSKFYSQGLGFDGFYTFIGIDQFEEENVLKRFLSLLEKVA